MRGNWWPAALFIVVLTPGVWSWGYTSDSYPSPPAWETSFPTCKNAATSPQSPTTLAVGANESFSTVTRLLGVLKNATPSVPLGAWSFESSSTFITFRVARPTPGLLAATVVSVRGEANPLTLVSSLSGRASALLALRQVWIRLGAEHYDIPPQTVNSDAVPAAGPSAELQLLFRDVSSGAAGILICLPLYTATTSSESEHRLVAAVVGQMINAAALLSVAGDASLSSQPPLTVRVSLLEDYNETVDQSAATVAGARKSFTRFVLPYVAGGKAFGTFVAYRGSVTTPPCEGPLQVFVARQQWPVSAATLQAIRDLTSGGPTTEARRPLASPLPVDIYQKQSVVIANASLADIAELGNGDTAATTEIFIGRTSRNDRMRIAIIVLISLAIAEVLIIATLLAARWEYIDLPTSWGGLARPIEFWQNPISHHTWGDVEEEERGSDDGSGSYGSGSDDEDVDSEGEGNTAGSEEEREGADRAHLSWSFEQ